MQAQDGYLRAIASMKIFPWNLRTSRPLKKKSTPLITSDQRASNTMPKALSYQAYSALANSPIFLLKRVPFTQSWMHVLAHRRVTM